MTDERKERFPEAETIAHFLCTVIDLTTEGRKEGYLASNACDAQEFLERLYAGDPRIEAAYHAIHKALTPQELLPNYLRPQENTVQ